MKLALVHDWLTTLGGAERVLKDLHSLFPDAPIYTVFARKDFLKEHLPNARVMTSFLQSIPGISRFHKLAMPLMPMAVESFDLSEFDTVISSSAFFAKGLILKPKTRHICYCYSPMRALWDRNGEYEKAPILRHLLRIWDRQSSDRVDTFVAISQHVKNRIERYYRKDASIIYPPLHALPETLTHTPEVKDYFLIVSRLYPYKNVHIAIQAFNKLGYKLVIVGDGPYRKELEQMVRGDITFIGHCDDATVASYYQHCKAFIMPQEEDFGLTALEAMSYGKPVLALKKGGALETITEGVTGEFFADPIPEALADGIKRLNEHYPRYHAETIKKSTESFSRERFKREILDILKQP